MFSPRFLFTVFLLAVIMLLPANAGSNMIGRQSQNEGILVLPAPAEVAIDGDLKEWDLSGRIWVFADSAIRNRYSVEASAMWDKQNLYLSAKWIDPTPMYSTIDPDFNVNEGWKSDAWQVRIRTNDKISHATMWYFAPKKQPVFHIQFGKSMTEPFKGEGTFWVAKENGTVLGRGIEMAYKKSDDGKGFTHEVKIPWNIICNTVPEWKAGDKIQLGMEFLWGDTSGKGWPNHRYADNMQPGATSREFFWTNWKGWGNGVLQEKGNVPIREYVDESLKIQGTKPVQVNIPKDTARFTVVIEDEQGKRIRNLLGDGDPIDYNVSVKDQTRTVEVKWDCLDENGKLVAPGTYRVRGLTHTGLSTKYEMSFYGPGTPPWPNTEGTGAWGADHSAPNNVAAAGEWTVVTWPVVEGGCGILGLDPTGQKRWSDKRGTAKVTGDANYVYTYVTQWYVREVICRYDAKTGEFRPFMLDGKAREFDLPLSDILGEDEKGKVTGMAVNGDTLALALSSGKIALLDANTAVVKKTIEAANPGDIAFSSTGILYAILDGKANRIDTATGTITPQNTPKLGKAGAIAVDSSGNLLIADLGPDSQVKAYSPQGKVVYTAGKTGGRALRGQFDEQTMTKMSSIAVDSKGQIWVVESWHTPRRVSVWGKDGKLVRDYVGNTGYAATCSFLHDQDAALGYVGPIEFKLDKENAKWKVSQVLWVPDKTKGESFEIPTGSHVHPQRFTSNASGQQKEYFYTHDSDLSNGQGHVVYMENNGKWQPVAAISLVGQISGDVARSSGIVSEQPTGELAGLSAYDGVIWNDDNEDGKLQRGECTVVLTAFPGTATKRGNRALELNNGWGGRIGTDLTIYTSGLTVYKPIGFSKNGAPRYGFAGMRNMDVKSAGDLVPVPGENRLLCLTSNKLMAVDTKNEKIEWTYPNPYHSVHGSHRATMPKPGLLIGPLKICGTANVNEKVGNVFMMRGNLGQDFFLTTDGLYVGALFQDCRLPGASLPKTEAELRGQSMDAFSEGGEPFNGWFGKQSDGKIRETSGIIRNAATMIEITGLDTIQRFEGENVTVDMATIVQADADNTARAKAASVPKTYTVKNITNIKIDGSASEWKDIKAMPIVRDGQPDKATAKIAYDANNLYLLYEVTDGSPWKNDGKDYTQLFKTGDAVDLHISTLAGDPAKDAKAGNIRVFIAKFQGKPATVLMRPVDPAAPPALKVKYSSPVGTHIFDRVELLADANAAVKTEGARYTVEAAIPLATLRLSPLPGLKLRGDIGFISSDIQGMINTARTYWSNPNTNLVNDLPQEAILSPQTWSEITFE